MATQIDRVARGIRHDLRLIGNSRDRLVVWAEMPELVYNFTEYFYAIQKENR